MQHHLLQDADSVKSVMNKLKKVICNILNVAPLETVVKRYEIDEAKLSIEEYMSELHLQDIRIMLGRCLLDRTMLHCETIEFHLEWSPEDHKLNEIRLLLMKAFSYLGKRVIITKITEGNFIKIICYAPNHLMKILLLKAEENIDQLKGMGLIHLTIGSYTVYDNTKDKVRD
jgi:CD48 antigen